MLDLKWIRENPEDFDAGLARRRLPPMAAEVLKLDEERRTHTKALQDMQARRNAASKEIGKAKGKGGDPAKAEALMAEVAGLKDQITAGEKRERELDERIKTLLSGIPNMLAPDVPDGKDESENVELRRWGTPRDFAREGFEPKQHFEIGEALGLMDFEAAAKISGARFTVLKGGLARLERALGQFMLDVQTGEHGYTEVNPPLLVKDELCSARRSYRNSKMTYFGANKADSEQERIASTHGFTMRLWGYISSADSIPISRKYRQRHTRIYVPRIGVELQLAELSEILANSHPEVPLTNLVRESILAEADLPYRFTALTPCFRAEAGAAGKDTRGMIRQHQFYKVEMVSITTPDQSQAEHARMTNCAEEILKRLDLPYRVVVLCSGDTGFAARKTYDIEVWLPGQNTYREISSCSNCGDFQARRMQARFRPKDSKDVQFVHTLNGSGLAVGRTLIAVIENYQERTAASACRTLCCPIWAASTAYSKN